MLLSVGAYAQGDGIKHRYPQLNFTYNGVEAFVPAWDMVMYQGGAYPGLIRLQITKVIREDLNDKTNNEYECKIVYRLGIRNDLSSFIQTGSSDKVTFTGFRRDPNNTNDKTNYVLDDDGNRIIETVEKASGSVNYADFINSETYAKGTWFEGTDYYHLDNRVFNYKGVSGYYNTAMYYVHGDLVIPEVYVTTNYGKFYITDIDMFAFRNNSADHAKEADKQKYWFRPESVTIPKTIKSIGKGAFFNNTSTTKIIFDSESPIKEIPPRVFMNDWGLEEITLPASLETIGGCALGGCEHLKKIIFTGEEAPELENYLHTNGNSYNFMQTTATSSFNDLTPAKCIMEVPLHSAKKYAEKDNLYKQFVMSSKLPITTSSGMTSFCTDHPYTFNKYDTSAETPTWNEGDVEAYYVTPSNVDLNNNNIELTKISGTGQDTKTIPLENPESDYGFGVILKGETGKTYDIFYPNNLLTNVMVVEQNLLQGVNVATEMILDDMYTYYALSGGKFHPIQLSDDPDPKIREQRNTIGAHKAFLRFTEDDIINLPEAREFTISFPDATGITTHEAKSGQNNVFYNLQGVQVKNPGKGVFIKNGKKYIIK